MKKHIYISILCLCLSHFLYSQSPGFYHLSTAEGLSDNNVIITERDQNGVLWIATTEGLNSFDGNRIRTYLSHQYPELPENHIERVHVDQKNRVWVRTSSHYVTMLDEKRKFHKILIGDTTDLTPVTMLFTTKSRGIIILKGRDHYFQDPKNPLRFEKRSVPFYEALKGPAGFIYELHDDKVVFYRNWNLVLVDYASLKIEMQMHFPGINGAHYINNEELLAFSSKPEIFYRISIPRKKIIREYRQIRDQNNQPVTGNLRNVTRINENRFAFTTLFSGLYLLDLQQETALHWVHDPVDPRSIGGNNTFNIRYDTSGYLFVTTQTSGVHFYNYKEQQAGSKPYFTDENKEIFDGYIQSITSDGGANVYLGAQDRFIHWNKETDKSWYVPLVLPNGTDLSGNETIRVVNRDESGQIWLGTSRYGLLVLDPQMKRKAWLTDSAEGIRTNFPWRWINAIGTGPDGNRWVGTLRGTCWVDPKDFSIRLLDDHPVLKRISRISCISLWNDGKGIMWIGTIQGIFRYDHSRQELKLYSTRDGLIHNYVYSVSYDKEGNTYFATAGGLSILSPAGQFTNYDRTNGLRNDRCEAVLRDVRGFIWVGNLNCILRYDPDSKNFTVFEEGLGFSHSGFRVRAFHQTPNGQLFWGTDRGLIYFFPEQINYAELPLHPSVNGLQSENEVYGFTGPEELSFPYNSSSFAFSFSSGELSGDRKNYLLYRLKGFDRDWKKPVTVGQAFYSQLPPNRYRFEVKASRDGIHWYNAPYSISLIITPPWWKQTWFRLSCLALGLIILIGITNYFRQRKLMREINGTIEYFARSPQEYTSVDDILWDITRNCISRLGFEDCVIYLPDEERRVLVQRAAFGDKNPEQDQIANPIEIPFGKGIVGDVALSGKPALVQDTTADPRYIVDDEIRYSELAVPIIHEGKVIGVIDSEHRRKNFFTPDHLAAMQTIASLCAAKISRTAALAAMKKSREELMLLNVKMAETKFLNLRLQMNPHFLFNSLSSIQHLIVSQQTNRAYHYLTVFSNFLRSLLNFAEKNFIPLDEELKILTMYVELESLRFDSSFSWEISADDSLSQDEVLVPSLMVQPFAENAIWHGLLHKEGDKKLKIRFASSGDDFLICIVEDNGVGRMKAAEIRNNKLSSRIHESKGIGIIRERLELLQQKTGKPASVEMEDLFDSTGQPAGTRVKIIIPYYNPDEI
ncbi:MAG: GAF domain-containing protein [Chitinophagaceae bacterium]